ncbi:MAG: MgtC/SapB family protein [Proteobacteria bacterium]|nr:MgtC/SapB family protein [Pseudomonadota bacterium]
MPDWFAFESAGLPGFVAALGGGLLVGLERERSAAREGVEAAIGLRTSALAATTGALAATLGPGVVAVATALVGAFAVASYRQTRQRDPGLTTELALLTTFLLGAFAPAQPRLAAAMFVVLTALLAGKDALHRFSRQALSKRDLDDILLLAATSLIVLPLLPDRAVGPYAVLNPYKLGLLVVWVMAVGAAGYVGLRIFGARRGLVIAGLLGGFVSSTATIAGMGQRARANAGVRRSCIAAGLASSVATLVQLALILLLVSPASLDALAWPLVAAGATAVVVSALALHRANHARDDDTGAPDYGRPFVPTHALTFVAIVAAALIGAAALQAWIGTGGVFAAAAFSGFADVHAATLAVAELVAANTLEPTPAARAIAIAFTANNVFKGVAAFAGGKEYFLPVALGLAAINASLVLTLALRA